MDRGAWRAVVQRVTKKSDMAVHELGILYIFYSFIWKRKWQPTPVFLPGGLQSMGLQRVRHNRATNTHILLHKL